MTCSICLDSFGDETCEKTVCSHIFHRKCLQEWATVNSICPLCRIPIQVEQEVKEWFEPSLCGIMNQMPVWYQDAMITISKSGKMCMTCKSPVTHLIVTSDLVAIDLVYCHACHPNTVSSSLE